MTTLNNPPMNVDNNTPAKTSEPKSITLVFNHPRGGAQFEAELGPSTTGTHAIEGLIREKFIEPSSRERAYTLQRDKTGTTIPLGEPLASLGIENGEVLSVIQTNAGAARLDPAQLRSRLAADYNIVMGMCASTLGEVRAYENAEALARKRGVTDTAAKSGKATLYLVDFTFPMLAAEGSRLSKATARFDLLASGNYPYSDPFVRFLPSYPWCLHVQPRTGTVCLGKGWQESRGRMLLGQLIVHVMRLANFDEPDRGPLHDAYDGRALQYWRETLGTGPLNRDLVYPALPTDITHGSLTPTDPSVRFAAVRNGTTPDIVFPRRTQQAIVAMFSPARRRP